MRHFINKKIFFVIIAFILMLQPVLTKASSTSNASSVKEKAKIVFTDLKKVPWAEKAIEKLLAKGIIKGNAEKRYYPERDITRGEFVGMLIKVLGLNADFTDNFTDVQKYDEYYQQLGTAKALGIIQGESCNRFRPKDPILRQDMMVYSTVALGVAKKLRKTVSVKVLDKYEDKYETSCYAFNSSATLVGEGLIVGCKNKLNSHSNASRASAAVLLYRIMKL